MGKQTKKSGSKFGGDWTIEKLKIVKDYLSFYVQALKNIKCPKIYIDAFAGSGKTKLKSGEEIDGSALISLNLDFDKYYFIDIDKERMNSLEQYINTCFPEKKEKITLINGDCNTELIKVLQSLNKCQRGVMFLDPYAMELDWNVLEEANKTEILDIWYLFPINAVVRQMPKNGNINEKTKDILNKTFGSQDWERALYYENPQMNLFQEVNYKRENFDKLVEYVLSQLKTTFAYVSPKSHLLKNSLNAPMFLLCFIMTNKSDKAIKLGSKVVTEIFESVKQLDKN